MYLWVWGEGKKPTSSGAAGQSPALNGNERKGRICMNVGIQMYSVRDISGDDLEGALRKVADIGYKTAEFAGFFGHSASEVRGWLDDLGLKVSGTHTPVAELIDKLEETVAYHKELGNVNIIIPWADLSTREKVDSLVDAINKLQPRLAKEGIALHYHNHDFEFRKNLDGVIPYDEIVSRTNALLEIDTYWAFVGGRDPLKMLDELGSRVKAIHVKDGSASGDGTPLGQGAAPVAAVWAKAKALNIYPVVESETLTPDGLTEAKICFDYLNALA
jgi:sugar phosphate isomerase/epimerase